MEILQQMGSLPIFFVMFLVIYFLMIRPQSMQQKKHKAMIDNLKVGDKIITRGGIKGNIVSIEGKSSEYLTIDTANNTKINVVRSYIASKL